MEAINSTSLELPASLSPDGLEFYFPSRREGNTNIYVSRRLSAADPFGTPEPLSSPINSQWFDSGPIRSLDGLTFFVTSNPRVRNTDWTEIFIVTRVSRDAAFSPRVSLKQLSSAAVDLACSIGLDGFYFFSNRRAGLGTPSDIYRSSINIALSIGRSGDEVTLSWPGLVGRVLEHSPSLSNPSWSIAPTGRQNPATISAAEGQRFFRLRPMQPLSVTGLPEILSVEAGEDVNLTVEAAGVGDLSLQWQKDGVDLPGETGLTLGLPSVQPDDSGEYQVVVHDSIGSFTRGPTMVEVTE